MFNIDHEEATPFELIEFAERLLERGATEDVTTAEEYVSRSGFLDRNLENFLKAWTTQIIAKRLKIIPSGVNINDIQIDTKYAEYKSRSEIARERVGMLRQNTAVRG